MVTHTTLKAPHKGAFTLIELLFSIVVMGLILLSLPPLFSTTSQNINEILKAQAVNLAYTRNQNVLTYFWDENSFDENDNNTTYILDTSGDNELARFPATSDYRKTAIRNGKLVHRKFFPYSSARSATSPPSLGSDSGENTQYQYDDIDDFHNFRQIVTKSAGDYLINMTINTKVYYINDATNYALPIVTLSITPTPINSTSSIKMIETNVSINNETILLMRNFACNIGQTSLATKKYQ